MNEKITSVDTPVAGSSEKQLLDILADEKELLGFYVSGHPLEPWRDVLDGEKFSRLGQIEELEMARKNKEGWWEGPRYSFGVLVQDVDQRFSKTSGNPFVESMTYPGNPKRLFVALFGITGILTTVWYTGFFSAIPLVGEPVREWLLGGDAPTFSVSFSTTSARFAKV